MAELFSFLKNKEAGGLAIVGMTKNVGKTVTLNYFIRGFTEAGVNLGLVSSGYDGERFDRLTLKEKPRIYAPAGSLVATAEACFEAAGAQLELLSRSPVSTPLGLVCLGKVVKGGLVELAGPGSIAGLQQLISQMKSMGLAQYLVDGAINRIASASPRVARGVILATGAAVAPVISDILRKTLFRCQVLQTPVVEDKSLKAAAEAALTGAGAALIKGGPESRQIEPVEGAIPLLAGEFTWDKFDSGTAAVVIGGALVENLLQKLTKIDPPPLIIIRDATKVFVAVDTYYRFLQRGGQLRVLEPINLITVTVNPTDPLGRGYPPGDFLNQMEQALEPLPVFDLVLSEGALTT